MGIPMHRALVVTAAVAVMAGLGTGSEAIEFFEGRLEIHGFYESPGPRHREGLRA